MADGADMRFSDTELRELSAAFRAHLERFDRHEAREEAFREDQLHRDQQQTEALNRLAAALEAQAKATAPLVGMLNDFNGFARVGHKVTDALIWMGKAGGILAAIAVGIHWILEHVPHR